MLDRLDLLPPDPILGVTAAFRADTSPDKVDLGVGVYRDLAGNTPVPRAVREAERRMLADQRTKVYVGPLGNLEFNERIVALALGPQFDVLRPRIATIQTVGGCGALRIGAELVRAARPEAVIHVSTPTWANHEPLVGSSGLALERYPYYAPATRSLDVDALYAHIERLPAGDVVLLHGCCHNPTGIDPTADQWRALARQSAAAGWLPLFDFAYQGFARGIEEDAEGLRIFAECHDELLVASSFSKNFGLYQDRTGALTVVGRDAKAALGCRREPF